MKRRGLDPAALATRRARWEAEHTRQVDGWAAKAAAVKNDRPDRHGLGLALHRRRHRRRARSSSTSTTSTPPRRRCAGPAATSASRPPRGSAGGSAPRSAPSWPRPSTRSSAAWATAPTSSARRPPRTGRRGRTTCPCSYVIFNNRVWNAVKRSVSSHAPQGWAVRTGTMPMSELEPAPDYEMIAQRLRRLGRAGRRSGGAAGRDRAQALKAVREDKRPGAAQRHLQEAVTARRLTVIATGPSGAPEELDPLRAAGHEVIIGRPLDMPGRRGLRRGRADRAGAAPPTCCWPRTSSASRRRSWSTPSTWASSSCPSSAWTRSTSPRPRGWACSSPTAPRRRTSSRWPRPPSACC